METSSERQEEKSIMVLWESGKTVHGFVRAFSRKTACFLFPTQKPDIWSETGLWVE